MLNNVYVFVVIVREGAIKLNIFVFEDLILYIMVKIIGFDEYGEYELKLIKIGVLF